MNPKKDDGARPTENLAITDENFSEWADHVAQAVVDGLNAAVLAEDQKQALEKASHQRSPNKEMDPIPPELLQAFADTHYIVHHEAPFVMHIGQPCPELKNLMAQHNALSAAFITAWNPFSQNLHAKENQVRHDELKANIKKRGLICIDGIGKHPSNNWPGEVSVLVLGLDLEAAKALARHYEQHAFVWTAGEAVPQLVQP